MKSQKETVSGRQSPLQFVKRYFVSLFFALIAVACLLYVARYLYLTAKNREQYAALQSIAQAGAVSESAAASSAAAVSVPIDFTALQKENADIYAWIKIQNTGIDYPILQNAAESDYYLDHNLDGSEGLPGALYTQNFQAKDFSDYNTVIYGHNMKDDSMFGSLHNYESADSFGDAPTITIYTPEHILTYRIFAAVQYSDVLIPGTFDFSAQAGRQAFLDSLKECRLATDHYDDTVSVTSDDRLITLSTCEHNSDHAHRYIVVGVLVDEQ